VDGKNLPTIPCVDMNDWLAGGERKANFVNQVRDALHDVGFFGVINAGTDMAAVDLGYDTMQEFFSAPIEKKDECHKPELGGARGYVHSETAQGHSRKDHKEHYHLGPIEDDGAAQKEQGAMENVFPSWMDMKGGMKGLFATMNASKTQIEGAMSLALGEEEGYLASLTKGGSALLRSLHYPSNPSPGDYWGAPHTDINLFTILPRATEEGLQVFLPKEGQHDKEYCDQEGDWIPVSTPPNCLIINGGDKLQAMSNGYFRSSVHRIVAKPNVERYSMVYFIHPRNECDVSPRPQSVYLSGIAKNAKAGKSITEDLGEAAPIQFPVGVNSQEMQMHRFMENGLVPVDRWDSKYALAVEAVVATGNTHHSVKTTSRLWKEMQAKAEAKKAAAECDYE